MAAEFIKLYSKNTDINKIEKIAECLRNGGVIIYPTDTVYGMGCDIHNARSVEKIAKLKGINPQKNNFSFICYDLSHISDYAKISNSAYRLLKKALPGPFTFVLETHSKIPKLFSNKKTVGIRVPDNMIARLIVKHLGNPIVTTSIYDDVDTQEYSTDPELIYEKFKDLVDIVIDGGYGQNEHSTIIDATTDNFEVIREGLGQIEDFL